MLLGLVAVAGVLLLPLPALLLGARGVLRRSGYSSDFPADRASLIVLVTLRLVTLLLVFALSVLTLVSSLGALIRGVELHGMVWVFFLLDLLLSVLVLLTFGRPDPRPARRRASPGARSASSRRRAADRPRR